MGISTLTERKNDFRRIIWESLVTWFTSTLGAHISREAIVFIISLFPILELRGGILASSLLDVTMWKGILISAVRKYSSDSVYFIFYQKNIYSNEENKVVAAAG